jgi:glutamate formiminotransferase
MPDSDPLLVAPVNISEGRRPEVIAAVAAAAESGQAHVLDRHSDPDHHRSVLTVAGPAGVLVDALLAAAAVAIERIDLAQHLGVHPRFGAVDVVPFVALDPADRPAAVAAAHRFAAAVAASLGVPCFYYEAAGGPSLPEVRRRAFRDLAPDVVPSAGGDRPHTSAGAIAVGVRGLLVAFNVDLATDDVVAARAIAARVRESGGGLRSLRALGLALGSRGITQVSMNLVRPLETTVGEAFDAVAAATAAAGIEVDASELVGLAPRGSLPVDLGRLRLRQPPKVLEDELAALFGDWVARSGPVAGGSRKSPRRGFSEADGEHLY